MKTLKSLTSIFMVIVLLIGVFPQSVIADPMLTFYIEDQTVNCGDTFDVAIKVKNNPGFNALSLTLKYDANMFEQVGKPVNKISEFQLTSGKNLVWVGDSNFSQDDTICLITFRAKEGVAIDSYDFKLIFRSAAAAIGNYDSKDVYAVEDTLATITIACPHTNKTKTEAKAATCKEAGNNAYYTCSDCSAVLKADGVTVTTVEDERLPKLAHKEIVKDAKEATCNEEGYTGDTYCELCDEKIKSGEAIPKNDNHDYQWVVDKEPTVKETGLKHEECTRCHAKRSENTIIEVKDCFHTTMEHHEKVDPTCSANGTIEYWHCTECDRNFSDEKGTLEVEDTVIPQDPANHVGKTEIRNKAEATCTEAGYTGDEVCTACNETVKKGEAIPAKGHTTEVKDAKEATCAEAGYTGDEICTVCNKTVKKGEIIPATNEHEEEVRGYKEADCSNEGYTGDTYCKLCGNKLKDGEPIPTNDNHDYQWVVDKEPTYEKTGLKHEECTRCHAKRSENTVIKERDCFHTTMEHHEKVDPTCSANGTIEYWHCTECDRNYSDEKGTLKVEDIVIPKDPTNHIGEIEIRNKVEATCTEAGYTGDEVCTVCNETVKKGEAIPAKGHTTEVKNAKEATCTEAGNKAYYICSGCDKWFEDANGTKEITDKTSVTTPAKGHTFATVWSSDDTDHWHAATCEHTAEVKDKAAHDFVGGTCSVCGYDRGWTLDESGVLTITNDAGMISWAKFGRVSNADKVKTLVIQDGMTSIADNAFESCSSLVNIIIPLSVTSIGNNAFESCTNLTSVTIPTGVTYVGDNVFSGCAGLTDIYCEVGRQPSGWSNNWNFNCPANLHWILFGDLDSDGTITEEETTEILGMVKGIDTLTVEEQTSSDFNHDGILDIRDYNYIYYKANNPH